MRSRQWFEEFEKHLMKDERPSVYFNAMMDGGLFPTHHPFGWLYKLRGLPQRADYHPEGDVWAHTMLVVDNAAKSREQSKDARALMWAALLHDIGKQATFCIRKGRVTAYDHDKEGAPMAEAFLRECGCGPPLVSRVAVLVRWHMQALFIVKDLPFADLEGMAAQADTDELALLVLADRLGRGQTKREEIEAEKQNVRIFVEKSSAYIAGRK